MNNQVDYAFSYREKDQYSDVSPYSPNSNQDQSEQEGDTVHSGDAIWGCFELHGDKWPHQEEPWVKMILFTLGKSKWHDNEKSFDMVSYSEVVRDLV